jgi:hypothetical protein
MLTGLFLFKTTLAPRNLWAIGRTPWMISLRLHHPYVGIHQCPERDFNKLPHCWNAPGRAATVIAHFHICKYIYIVIYGRALAQAVSRQLPTAAACVRSQVRSCGTCGGQSGTGAGYIRALPFHLPITLIITYHPGLV